MATGLAAAGGNTALDAIRTDTPFIKLHIGDPGAAGTSNPATETTRKAVTFAAASGSSMASSADITWTSIAGSEDATHFSIWNASTSGTFKFSGTITANAFVAGDTYTIPSGSLVLTITPAS